MTEARKGSSGDENAWFWTDPQNLRFLSGESFYSESADPFFSSPATGNLVLRMPPRDKNAVFRLGRRHYVTPRWIRVQKRGREGEDERAKLKNYGYG